MTIFYFVFLLFFPFTKFKLYLNLYSHLRLCYENYWASIIGIRGNFSIKNYIVE